ncbi:MAG: nicotinamide-nucleotide amidase [Verrucomicrobiales bacterium]|jgi:nicotinamide-nucleotide amidase
MIVEVIAVGTELLLGEIINTNVADIGVRLAEDGFDVHHQVTVGDNLDRLVATIRTASGRADAVILTGGIGPTQDDQTRDAICVVLGVGLSTDAEHAEAIRDRLAQRGVVADTALRMADYPEGSDPLPNSNGVALGIAAVHEGTPIFAVPGVPVEMRAMVDQSVRPRLREMSGEPSVLASRLLHCWGLGESQIAEQLDDLYESTNPSVAFLIKGPEVRVRITAKAGTGDEAAAMIADVERIVRDRLGDTVFAADEKTVDELVEQSLAEQSWSIDCLEVCTRGLVAFRLAAMQPFMGGLIRSSAEQTPVDVENDAADLLDRHMSLADVTLVVGEVTEQATNDGAAARQIGIAIRTPDGDSITSIRALGNDERARTFAVSGALHLLRKVLAAT